MIDRGAEWSNNRIRICGNWIDRTDEINRINKLVICCPSLNILRCINSGYYRKRWCCSKQAHILGINFQTCLVYNLYILRKCVLNCNLVGWNAYICTFNRLKCVSWNRNNWSSPWYWIELVIQGKRACSRLTWGNLAFH